MAGRILFCNDFSENAVRSLRCIGNLPGIRAITLFHVVDATRTGKQGWTYEPGIENARLVLNDEKEELAAPGLTVSVRLDVITGGDVPEAILAAANEEEPDLLVIGPHGRGIAQQLGFGSVSKSVLRHANRDVLIYRDRAWGEICPDIFARVLLAIDLPGPEGEAKPHVEVPAAIPATVPQAGKILLLHVVAPRETREEMQAAVTEAQEKLHAIAARFPASVKLSVHVRIGKPAEEILRFARDEQAGLVVIGTHRKAGIGSLLSGGTGYEVAERAGCSVLVRQAGNSQPLHGIGL